ETFGKLRNSLGKFKFHLHELNQVAPGVGAVVKSSMGLKEIEDLDAWLAGSKDAPRRMKAVAALTKVLSKLSQGKHGHPSDHALGHTGASEVAPAVLSLLFDPTVFSPAAAALVEQICNDLCDALEAIYDIKGIQGNPTRHLRPKSGSHRAHHGV